MKLYGSKKRRGTKCFIRCNEYKGYFKIAIIKWKKIFALVMGFSHNTHKK
jgi:hypothetical protein